MRTFNADGFSHSFTFVCGCLLHGHLVNIPSMLMVLYKYFVSDRWIPCTVLHT